MVADREQSAFDSNRDGVEKLEDSFSVLGDETRLRILVALTEEANEHGMGAGLSFSELRSRVDVEDSGRFNYHLNELGDKFVTQVDDRYVARLPGLAIVAAVYAGTYQDPGDVESRAAETDLACGSCSEPLTVHYGTTTLFSGVWTECDEHGEQDHYPVPAGAETNRSVRELMRVAYTRALTNLDFARRNICLQCWGTVSLEYPVDSPTEQFPDKSISVRFSCERCWNGATVTLRSLLARYPLVAGAFAERDYTLIEAIQRLSRTGDGAICSTELRGEEPRNATVRVAFDGETLVLDVDESCTVVDHRWE